MDLILWRHAEAHDPKPGQDDLSRALTARGERQADRMAAWLNRLLPSSTRVLASPARRTQQTVAALERKFKTVDALGPDEGVEALLHAARWPDARRMEFCHAERRVVIRRGWEPIAEGCLPGAQDTVIPLE